MNLGSIVKLARLANFKAIIVSSRSRTRSTTHLRQLNNRFDDMIRINFDEAEKRVLIALRCKIEGKTEREFHLNRSEDEVIGTTFEKLYANYLKHAMPKMQKAVKKQKANSNTENNNSDDSESLSGAPPIFLYDMGGNLVDTGTKNKTAWVENFKFQMNEQTYRVCINLPRINKISLPKFMLSGFPTVAKIECDSEAIEHHSVFAWYASERCYAEADKKPVDKKHKAFDLAQVNWTLIESGRAKRMCVLPKHLAGHLVRVECVPGDGEREGVAVEAVTVHVVEQGPDIDALPMTVRHGHTQKRLDKDELNHLLKTTPTRMKRLSN